MVGVLEQKIGLITLLLIFTFQSGLAASVRAHPKTEDPFYRAVLAGRAQAQIINRWFDVVYVYDFAYEKHLYGSNPAKENITEFYFQEGNCTRNDMYNTKKACMFNPKGKIIICHMKTLPVDFTNCKFTGDKYDLPKTDRRSENYAVFAAQVYNKKNYKPKSPLRVSLDVTVTSDLKREVTTGTKNVLQFSTKELNCTKSLDATGNETMKCYTLKPRLDCEATVNEPMRMHREETNTGTIYENKTNVDVKCEENKSPDDVTAMRNKPPPDMTACRVILFNPTATTSRNVTDCLEIKNNNDTYSVRTDWNDRPQKKAGSEMAERSTDKEGNNKTAETMSSGSVPKKASSSKTKAKNNLTKTKPKATAMKLREAKSKRADQPEEDVAYASSDKGQPPIPPIIPKELIKKEKVVTKAPRRQNTPKIKNKENVSKHSIHVEEDSEEAKFEKKKPISKASARQVKANDGGKIVSAGKEVKVPHQPERFLAGKEDKRSHSKPKKGAAGSGGKQKATAAKEIENNQKNKEEKEKNEDEKKHPDDEDKITKVSEPKLKT